VTSRRTGAARAAALEPQPPRVRDDRPLGGAVSFGHAWSLLRQGDAKGAAAEFADVERLARGRDIEEDALYWRAVAVGRTGDSATARQLFGEFLDRFPASSRAGEAALASGWMLLEAGEPRAARRAFERAARDPSPRVQVNAQEGLQRTQEEDR
jgi:TolA-binding protein